MRSSPSFGLGSSHNVGGSTRWCRASAALITPATPAAGMVWLIIDLTVPTAQRGCSPARPPNTRASASISVASPTAVPVPWASISPTLRGSIPLAS